MANTRLEIIPVIPKKNPFGPASSSRAKVMMVLRNIGHEAQRRLSDYPASQSDYLRTGTLGRAWTTDGPRSEGGNLVVKVGNKTEYAPFVQGREPVSWAQTYGWPNVVEVAEAVWGQYKGPLTSATQGH